VPLLKQKPGALRDGAPFTDWALPKAIIKIKQHCLQRVHGDRDFVELLLLIQDRGIELVTAACELAVEAKTLQLSAIINLINRLTETESPARLELPKYSQLQTPPEANCRRYNQLLVNQGVV